MNAYQKIQRRKDTINQLGHALQRMTEVEWGLKNDVQSSIGLITLNYYEKCLEALEDELGDDAYALQDLRELLSEARRRLVN